MAKKWTKRAEFENMVKILNECSYKKNECGGCPIEKRCIRNFDILADKVTVK